MFPSSNPDNAPSSKFVQFPLPDQTEPGRVPDNKGSEGDGAALKLVLSVDTGTDSASSMFSSLSISSTTHSALSSTLSEATKVLQSLSSSLNTTQPDTPASTLPAQSGAGTPYAVQKTALGEVLYPMLTRPGFFYNPIHYQFDAEQTMQESGAIRNLPSDRYDTKQKSVMLAHVFNIGRNVLSQGQMAVQRLRIFALYREAGVASPAPLLEALYAANSGVLGASCVTRECLALLRNPDALALLSRDERHGLVAKLRAWQNEELSAAQSASIQDALAKDLLPKAPVSTGEVDK